MSELLCPLGEPIKWPIMPSITRIIVRERACHLLRQGFLNAVAKSKWNHHSVQLNHKSWYPEDTNRLTSPIYQEVLLCKAIWYEQESHEHLHGSSFIQLPYISAGLSLKNCLMLRTVLKTSRWLFCDTSWCFWLSCLIQRKKSHFDYCRTPGSHAEKGLFHYFRMDDWNWDLPYAKCMLCTWILSRLRWPG